MSHEAVDWAKHHSPMLRTEKGKPDSMAREILVELAEHADKAGHDAYPSVLHIQWATGYDESTIRRAFGRLEKAGLISRMGTRKGCVLWRLDMSQRRPDSDLKDLLDEAEKKAEKNAAYQARHREKVKAVDQSGAQSPLRIDDDQSDGADVRDSASLSKGLSVPTSGILRPNVRDATRPEPSVNLPGTSLEPPTGGAPPPDPRRPESPSAPRNEHENSISIGGDQPPRADTFTHDRTRETKPNTDGFHMPKGCGYRDCMNGYVVPSDNTPPYQCPRCNSNVIPLFAERKAK